MSFYVSLPSNSSLKYYPENTLQSYKTKLETPLKFECNYEVGLCEILFPKDFLNYIGLCLFNQKHSKYRRGA